MISTKNLELDENNVPSAWVFQYYLDLPERLTGQNVRIHSIFNPGERTPSMWVFVDNGTREYKYKDFSTGNYGNKIDLVKELYNIDFSKAIFKIINDYNKFTLEEGKYSIEVKNHAKYKVDYCHTREWNKLDQVYWLKFNIGKTLLSKYNVKIEQADISDPTEVNLIIGDKKLNIDLYDNYNNEFISNEDLKKLIKDFVILNSSNESLIKTFKLLPANTTQQPETKGGANKFNKNEK